MLGSFGKWNINVWWLWMLSIATLFISWDSNIERDSSNRTAYQPYMHNTLWQWGQQLKQEHSRA